MPLFPNAFFKFRFSGKIAKCPNAFGPYSLAYGPEKTPYLGTFHAVFGHNFEEL